MFFGWSSLIGICEGIRVELIVRGEALGFVKDELLRKHLPRTVFIDQERKLGDRRRSDTVVVLTINHAD